MVAPENSALQQNTARSGSVTSTRTGVFKYQWAALFTSVGIANGAQDLASGDPALFEQYVDRNCANFDAPVCQALIEVMTVGYPSQESIDFLRSNSVASYVRQVRVPTLIGQGQADTLERKREICARAYRLLTEDGFPPEDIVFDPNVFAVATGIEEHDGYGTAFIEAVRFIRTELPPAHVSGGVSNLSFSFRGNEPVREAMHAVFLYHAVQAGMDMGIVNAGQLAVYEDIPKDLLERVEDVIWNRRPDATERLVEMAEQVKGKGKKKEIDLSWREGSVEERLSHALVQGIPDPLSGTVDAPIGRHPWHHWKFAVLDGGRPSVTHYETLEVFGRATLLEVHLETGRTHQIRVHTSALRHPCVGDLTYGADPRLAA